MLIAPALSKEPRFSQISVTCGNRPISLRYSVANCQVDPNSFLPERFGTLIWLLLRRMWRTPMELRHIQQHAHGVFLPACRRILE